MIKNLLVVADMEGASLVRTKHQVFRKSLRPLKFGLEAMEHDVNCVLEGLHRGGAERAFILDWHDTGRNLRKRKLRKGINTELFGGGLIEACERLKSKVDAAIFVGFHSCPEKKAVLAHCYSFEIKKFRMGGRQVGETTLNLFLLYRYGIPLIFVSGSQEAINEAKFINRKILGAPTKRGYKISSRRSVRKGLIEKTIKSLSSKAGIKKLKTPVIDSEFEKIVQEHYKKNKITDNMHILNDPEIK